MISKILGSSSFYETNGLEMYFASIALKKPTIVGLLNCCHNRNVAFNARPILQQYFSSLKFCQCPKISRKLSEIQYGANAPHASSTFSDFSKLHRKLLRNVVVKQDISVAKIHSVLANRCEIYFSLTPKHIKSNRHIPISLNNNVFSALSGRLSIN